MVVNLPRCLAIATLLLLPGFAAADVLHIPQQVSSPISVPERGRTLQQVEARFGTPQARHPQVGGGHPQRPPITRWDYSEFSVVFERDRVINTVRRDGQTAPTRGQESLEISSETLPAAD